MLSNATVTLPSGSIRPSPGRYRRTSSETRTVTSTRGRVCSNARSASAVRPAFSVLAVGRFEAAVGRRVEPWEMGLSEYLTSLG